jgi:hypothetical protein
MKTSFRTFFWSQKNLKVPARQGCSGGDRPGFAGRTSALRHILYFISFLSIIKLCKIHDKCAPDILDLRPFINNNAKQKTIIHSRNYCDWHGLPLNAGYCEG